MPDLRRTLANMSPRTRAILGAVATVVVLAVVIFALSALSDPVKKSGPQVARLDLEKKSGKLYEEALDALSSGETTRASDLLQEAVAIDSSNNAAKKKLAEVQSDEESSTTPDQNEGSGTDTSSQDQFLKPVANMGRLLPSTVKGHTMGYVDVTKSDATRTGTPTSSRSPLSRVVWAVHDRKDAKGAAAFVARTSKRAFPKNGSSVTVDGVGGYFGSDGAQFATVVYTRGRYVFELIITAPAGDAASYRQSAVEAAVAFPDAP